MLTHTFVIVVYFFQIFKSIFEQKSHYVSTCFYTSHLHPVFYHVGDSAGGNIAHQVALRTIRDTPNGIRINGVMLIHPYFGSEKRTKREVVTEAAEDVKMNDMFWRLSLPEGSNRDYFGCNYERAELQTEEWQQFPAVVVYVAELDFLKERGSMYAEFLQKEGVKEVKVEEAKGESHVYHVFHPKSESTRLLQRQMSDFMKSF